METKEMANELSKKLRHFRSQSYKVDISSREAGNAVFVQKKEVSYINPKYLKMMNYFEILGLEDFVKTNPNLTQEKLDEILSLKVIDFAFLNELNNSIDNMLEELKSHGALAVAIIYVNNKLYPKQECNV